jgi:hypothetical protein
MSDTFPYLAHLDTRQDGRRIGTKARTPAKTHVYIDYSVPEIGDIPREDYILPLDVESAAALGSALLAASNEAKQ